MQGQAPKSKTSSENTLWLDDAFGRRDDAEFLQRFLVERTNERKSVGRPGSYVLNLDSGWGRGKTFFLERFSKHLESSGFLVARVNAWEDDHADDPLLAVMAAIEQAVRSSLANSETERRIWKAVKSNAASIIVAAAKGGAKHLAKKVVGDELDNILDIAQDGLASSIEGSVTEQAVRLIDRTAERLLQSFSETQQSISRFREELGRLLKTIEHKKAAKLPLFVFVDELDRCRPPYAITLLERVKHLFDIDGVVFLIATDTGQLRHSIRAVYGQGFDAEKYLYRFFDRTYRFEQPSRSAFVEAILSRQLTDPKKISLPVGVELGRYITDALDYFNLPLRDCEQCIDIFRTVLTSWDIAFPTELVVMVPLIIAFQQGVDLKEQDFSVRMGRMAEEHQGGVGNWSYHFSGFAGRHGEQINALSLCERFRRLAAVTAFSDLKASGPNISAGETWVLDRLTVECLFLGGLKPQKGKTHSMINEYPQMIRSAGRLTPI